MRHASPSFAVEVGNDGQQSRPTMKVGVFFERDGILTVAPSDGVAGRPPAHLGEFRVREDLADVLMELRQAGFLLFATTNQPGLTSGAVSRREVDLMHAMLTRKLGLDGVLVCPHAADDGCPCRKPQAGLLVEAAHRYKLDLQHSFVVSDTWEDAEMAAAAGATSVLVRSRRNGDTHHDCVVGSVAEAAAKVVEIARGMGTLQVVAASGRRAS